MQKLILNRLKVVLAEKGKKNQWLASQLAINTNTVSKWVNNVQQPPLLTFYHIAIALDADLPELFASIHQNNHRS